MIRGFYIAIFLTLAFSLKLSAKTLQLQDTTAAYEYLQTASDFRTKFQYDSSSVYLKLAAEEFKENEVWHRFIFCQYNVGYNLSSQRKHQDALDYMLKVEEEDGDHFNPARASTFGFYWQVAWAHFMLANYSQALAYYDKVQEAMEVSEDPVNDGQRVRLVYDKGVIFQRLRQYSQAMGFNNKVLELGELYDYHNYDANALNNLGIINKNLGEYELSLNYYERAFELASESYKQNGGNLVGLCPFYVNFSKLYLELGNIEKSHEKSIEGLKVYEENATRWWSVYSSLKYNLIDVYFKMNEYDKALEESRNTLKYASEQGGPGLHLAGIMRYMGKSFYHIQMYDSSEYYFRQYFDLAGERRSFIEGNSMVHLDLAELYADQGRIREALAESQLGIMLMSEGFNSPDIKDNPSADDIIINNRNLLSLMSHKTRYLLALGEDGERASMDLAYKTNRAAREVVSRLRENLYFKSSKLALGEFANRIYEQGIIVNQNLYTITGEHKYLDELLNCFEGNRANLIAEAFQVSKVNGYTSLPDSLIAQEVGIYNQIAEKEASILRSTDSTKTASLRNDIFNLKHQYEQVLDQKGQFQLQAFGVDNGILISEIQDLLDREEMILEYFAGEKGYHLLSITSNSVNYYDLGSVGHMDSLVTDFVDLIKDPKSVDLGKLGFEIYNNALNPVLVDKNPKTLIIIPDGAFSYLPFEALVANENESIAIDDYLVNRFTMRSHYSAALFKKLSEIEPFSDLESYIGFAPDFDKESNPLLARRFVDNEELSAMLDNLPGAELEVQTAADFFNGDAVTGAGATESYFKQIANNYNVIHLASHTLVDLERPLYSKLVFANEESDEDGLLHLYELYGMNLKCSLVSLSACNTGIGRTYKGEGMMSLGRGFMGAGAQNVLMTLWSVSDQSSSSIMNAFFEKIEKGTLEPKALRQAKLDYLKNADELTSHPYYWAGYSFIGNGSRPGSNYKFWLIGIVMVLSALLVARRFRASS
jgi:CHAT domain-containing protein